MKYSPTKDRNKKLENGLYDISCNIFETNDSGLLLRCMEMATEFDSKLKHIECTNWFNRVCHETQKNCERIYVERTRIQYSHAPVPTSMYRITCSADGRSSEFWMSGHPFPKTDKGERARKFIDWCKYIVDVYDTDPLYFFKEFL